VLLADLPAVGRRITISGLSKIENGDRRIDVDDLMAIAVALDVSPAALLLPRSQPGDVVDVTGRRASTLLFWQWALASDCISGDKDAFLERSLPSWVTGGS
jgi:transcriptional regulator with XRE-family HTH domain